MCSDEEQVEAAPCFQVGAGKEPARRRALCWIFDHRRLELRVGSSKKGYSVNSGNQYRTSTCHGRRRGYDPCQHPLAFPR